MSNHEKMLTLAKAAMKHAYAPYSHFPVGVCLRTADDNFFAGCNIENAAFPLGLCAESGALSQLVCNGHLKIAEVLVIANTICPPCGSCRQRLSEFSDPSTLFHLYNLTGEYKKLTLQDLFPHPFNAQLLEQQ